MPDIDEDDWEVVDRIERTDYDITYPWHFVSFISDDWARLYLKASGEWSCLGSAFAACGADGHSGLALAPERLLVAKCAPGALIGKLGGSPAGFDDSTTFSIGSRCLVAPPKKQDTFLYIGVNGAIAQPTNRLTRIKLEIFGMASASPPDGQA
jgi:hypothetical protein